LMVLKMKKGTLIYSFFALDWDMFKRKCWK
jgi:hypothetical protein